MGYGNFSVLTIPCTQKQLRDALRVAGELDNKRERIWVDTLNMALAGLPRCLRYAPTAGSAAATLNTARNNWFCSQLTMFILLEAGVLPRSLAPEALFISPTGLFRLLCPLAVRENALTNFPDARDRYERLVSE